MALVVNEMKGLEGLYITSTVGETQEKAGPFSGTNLAHCFGFLDRIPRDVLVLALMAAGYLLLVMLVMELFIKEKR